MANKRDELSLFVYFAIDVMFVGRGAHGVTANVMAVIVAKDKNIADDTFLNSPPCQELSRRDKEILRLTGFIGIVVAEFEMVNQLIIPIVPIPETDAWDLDKNHSDLIEKLSRVAGVKDVREIDIWPLSDGRN